MIMYILLGILAAWNLAIVFGAATTATRQSWTFRDLSPLQCKDVGQLLMYLISYPAILLLVIFQIKLPKGK